MASAQNDKLVIFRGDDTGGTFGRTLAFTIEAAEGVSLDGCRAEWIFDGIVKQFDAPLIPGEVREVFYSHNETRCMALGVRYGTFRIIDAAGKRATMTNTHAVEVTSDVARCYPGSSSATVHVSTIVTWEQIGGKPLLVKTINGVAPDASGNIILAVGGDVKHADFADIETKEGMTLKEVGSMVNTLARKLKGGAASLLLSACCLSAFCAFADETIPLSPDMDFGDVHPTQKLDAVIHTTVDGAARPLPAYLHALDFADSYPDAAAEYYRSRGNGKTDGGCSAVRSGGFLYRNFDYPFDDRAEFVVHMSASTKRFASVGVAQVGTNLTEQIVTSGKPSRCYKWLPGATVDGINENGVVCEINVVDGDPATSGWHTGGDIHPLGAVRWALDHGTSAAMVASNLAARIAFPDGWAQNFHYMIADETETYIVENGAASNVTAVAAKRVMTNFPILPDTYEGMGRERYDLLLSTFSTLSTSSTLNITNAWYTRAYRRETTPPWVSDLAEVIAYTNAIFDAWAAHDKEYFRGKANNGIPWWQTVHTSIYDITNRTLRVAVQETDDWYVFAVPAAADLTAAYAYTDGATNALGTALRREIAAATPADYANVSNAAVNARSMTNLVYTTKRGIGNEWDYLVLEYPSIGISGWYDDEWHADGPGWYNFPGQKVSDDYDAVRIEYVFDGLRVVAVRHNIETITTKIALTNDIPHIDTSVFLERDGYSGTAMDLNNQIGYAYQYAYQADQRVSIVNTELGGRIDNLQIDTFNAITAAQDKAERDLGELARTGTVYRAGQLYKRSETGLEAMVNFDLTKRRWVSNVAEDENEFAFIGEIDDATNATLTAAKAYTDAHSPADSSSITDGTNTIHASGTMEVAAPLKDGYWQVNGLNFPWDESAGAWLYREGIYITDNGDNTFTLYMSGSVYNWTGTKRQTVADKTVEFFAAAPTVTKLATSNMVEGVVADATNATLEAATNHTNTAVDYALRSSSGAAVSLVSGEIVTLTTDAATSNLFVTLNFAADATRSGDEILYLANAADTTLSLAPAATIYPVGIDLGEAIPAGTNLVTFTRLNVSSGVSTVLISTKQL